MMLKNKKINKIKNSVSSSVGHWAADNMGLPIFVYTGKLPFLAKAADGIKITYPEDPWFLLGNYAITCFVHAAGSYDLFTLHRAWGRLNVPFGKKASSSATVSINGKINNITGLDSSIACQAEKEFGTGFAHFRMNLTDDIACERTIAIPPSGKINEGISAALITIKLTNNSSQAKQIIYQESVLANYQMLNEDRIKYESKIATLDSKILATFIPKTDKTIQKPNKDEASTYDFYPPTLFLKGDGITFCAGDNDYLAAKKEFELKSGQSKTLSFVVGFANDGQDVEALIAPLFEEASRLDPKFRKAWKEALPDYSDQHNEVIRREQYWNTYVLEASAKYNAYFEETFIPQGMTYDYIWGLNAVARDHLHYSLAANYFNPNLSKSIIRFVLKKMNPNGYFHYNVNGFGYAVPNLWNPSDLQLHLFWAVAEYLEQTKDYEFLKAETTYYPKRINYNASVIEKLKIAFDYLNDEIATGPHGLVKMLNADWNDQIWNEQPITIYYPTAESHYNASMAIVVLKKLVKQLIIASNDSALLQEKNQLDSLVERISLYQEKQQKAFLKDLGNRSFAKRAYYNENLSMGDEHMHIESQLYTLMIEEIPLEQRKRIVEQAAVRLSDHEVLGLRTSEHKVSDTFEEGTHENGGIWQYVQGMYALGLLHVDIDKADEAIQKMSFQNFAKNYPDYWPGQWTGADTVSSSLAKYPGLVSNNGSEYMEFPTYCAHIHAWPLLYQFKRKEINTKEKEL